MNKIGVLIEIASISCGKVTSFTLEVLSIWLVCHSVENDENCGNLDNIYVLFICLGRQRATVSEGSVLK
jgi:hypothetical protein